MKQFYKYILGLVVLSIILVFFLKSKIQHHEGQGFLRKIVDCQLNVEANYNLPPGLFLFSGFSKSKVFLQNLKSTDIAYSIDFDLKKMSSVDMLIPKNVKKENSGTSMYLAGNSMSILSEQTGELFHHSLVSNVTKTYILPKMDFIHHVLLPNNIFVAKSLIFYDDKPQRILTKVNYVDGKILDTFKIPKQIDGFFSTDGMLSFSREQKKLVYAFFYRGQFLCLDSNLKVLYSAKTIDTVTQAAIYLKENVEENALTKSVSTTMSRPPTPVNRNLRVSKNNIYIWSALKADNESGTSFIENQVVDVYRLQNGTYSHSFYVPNFRGVKFRYLEIVGDKVYCIYPNNHLVKFSLGDLRACIE